MLAFFLRILLKQHTEVHMAANVGPKSTINVDVLAKKLCVYDVVSFQQATTDYNDFTF